VYKYDLSVTRVNSFLTAITTNGNASVPARDDVVGRFDSSRITMVKISAGIVVIFSLLPDTGTDRQVVRYPDSCFDKRLDLRVQIKIL